MKVTFRDRAPRLLAGVAGAALIGAFAAMPASAQDVASMNILTANHESCGLYPEFVAEELGINKDLGITTVLLNSDTSIPYVAFLQTGDAETVMLDSAQVMQMEDKEPGTGVVIYEAMQFAPEGIVVPADSPIQGLDDLHDVTVGLASDRDQITTIIALDSIGKTMDDANVETVVTGDSGPIFAKALEDGSIAAFAGSSSDRAYLEAVGYEFRNITPAAVSENPGNSFAVARSRLESDASNFQAFVKGWAMAQHSGSVDIKAVMEVCKKNVPEEFENLQAGYNLINEQVTVLQLRRTVMYGDPQPDVWLKVQSPYIKLGEIGKELDPANFLDRRFIDEANNFTSQDIKKYIAAWREANPDLVLP